MADPMRIRATEQPDGVDVRVLMSHEMETGQRRDSAGNHRAGALHSNCHRESQRQAGAERRMGPGGCEESRTCSSSSRAARRATSSAVTWVDNKGDTRTDEATIG